MVGGLRVLGREIRSKMMICDIGLKRNSLGILWTSRRYSERWFNMYFMFVKETSMVGRHKCHQI